MQALSAHARKACSGKLTCIKQLLGHKQAHIGHHRPQSAETDQCRHASTMTNVASAGRKRQWPRRLAFMAVGSTGLGLAVASGGESCGSVSMLVLPLWMHVAHSDVGLSHTVSAPQVTRPMHVQYWPPCHARAMRSCGWHVAQWSTLAAWQRTPAKLARSMKRLWK